MKSDNNLALVFLASITARAIESEKCVERLANLNTENIKICLYFLPYLLNICIKLNF